MNGFVKIYFENMSIGALGSAKFSLYYDGEFKKLHILDLDKGGRSITNSVDKNFFLQIDAYLTWYYNADASSDEYDIYLYGTDGVICEYEPETNAFKYVEPLDGHIYEPFKKVCNQRFFDLNI